MKKALGVLLGVSILVNVLALGRLARRDAPAPAPAKTRQTTVREETRIVESTDLGALLAEIRAIRADLAGAKAAPSTLRDDPEVAGLLRDEEALERLWTDLQKVSPLEKSLGDAKYRELVLKMTAEFLRLDAGQIPGFSAAAELMVRDLEEAAKEYEQAENALAEDENLEDFDRKSEELTRRYEERTKAAVARLDSFLGSDARHKRFRDQAAEWAWYFHPQGEAAFFAPVDK